MPATSFFQPYRSTILWIALNFLIAWTADIFIPPNAIYFVVTMWFPALSAVLFLLIEKIPLKAALNLQAGTKKSYALALVIPSIVAVFTVIMGLINKNLTLNPSFEIKWLSAFLTLIIWIISSLGEEIGWRGFLHNRLRPWSHAPILTGLIWSLWHWKSLLAQQQGLEELAIFTLLTIFLSFILSSLIETGGSIWGCGLFHGVWNFWRMKILFGHAPDGPLGIFISNNPSLTEMEGVFGIIVTAVITMPIIRQWYRRIKT